MADPFSVRDAWKKICNRKKLKKKMCFEEPKILYLRRRSTDNSGSAIKFFLIKNQSSSTQELHS